MELIDKLKEHCHQRHLQVRAGEYASKIMDGSLTKAEYTVLILANYVFHNTLELSLNKHLAENWKLELSWHHRAKSVFARQDLRSLGCEHLIVKLLDKEPLGNYSIDSGEQAIGALYVAEGTAIGGVIIKKNLQKIDWIVQNDFPIRFYGCYGQSLSPLWKEFVAFVCQVEVNHESVLNQAYQTFEFYEQILLEAQQVVANCSEINEYQKAS